MMTSRTIEKAQALFAIPAIVAQKVADYFAANPSPQSYTDEEARDAVGAALRAPAGMAWSIDDASDTIALGVPDAAAFRQAIGVQLGTAAGQVPVLDATAKWDIGLLPDAVVGGVKYQGTWNASTNVRSPQGTALPSASGSNKGFYYKVTVAGTTTIDGIADWSVGDWAISNGSTWDKIDNTDSVTSVAGLMGIISDTSLAAKLASYFQASDADLEAIAALATTPFGRNLLTLTAATDLLTAAGAMPRKQPIVAYTASATATAADAEALVRITVASANTYTLPANATVALPVGTRIDVQQVGAGKTTIAAASGVTIETTNKSISAQWGAVSAIKIATDTWTLIGALSA